MGLSRQLRLRDLRPMYGDSLGHQSGLRYQPALRLWSPAWILGRTTSPLLRSAASSADLRRLVSSCELHLFALGNVRSAAARCSGLQINGLPPVTATVVPEV